MNIDIQIAILGIVGTLMGTVLGWLLNNLSRCGKINIYVSSWVDEFMYNNSGYIVASSSIEQTECYQYNLSLDLYNSSGEIKIMRDIKVLFTKGKRVVYKSIPTFNEVEYIYHSRGKVENSVVNIPAKTIVCMELHEGVWQGENDALKFIWDTDSVYLSYKDEKNKEKKILIKNQEYEKTFDD